MRVLLDYHHADLAESLHLLFADRFGWAVHLPVGMEWWDGGYWQFGRWTWGDDRLGRQFLTRESVEVDNANPQRRHSVLTLPEAQEMGWDYVVASVPDNYEGYHRFAREHGAQFVIQCGNTNQPIAWELDPLVLNSSEMPIRHDRGVTYRQEFDTSIFRYRPPTSQAIASFVNCMDRMPCWWALQEARELLPDHEFRIHGIDGEHGNVKPTAAIADAMGKAGWAWHDKVTGDGFGHVIHNWASIGRPLIGHASHYAGKQGEPFWRDGETCIDLDRHSVTEAAEIIRGTSPERHREMCEAMRTTFEATVDFDGDATKVRALLESVL